MTKTLLITGVSSGFGRETALLFAKNGWRVVATVRNPDSQKVRELQKIVTGQQLSLTIIEMDVAKDYSVEVAINKIKKVTPQINVLINNAGFGLLGAVEDFSIDEAKQQFETNFFGMLRVTKAILPIMRKQRTGTIINISSINGLIPFPFYSIYAASKYAIEAITESLRVELAPFGIKVALIEPGSFLTDFFENRKHPHNQNNSNSPYASYTQAFFKKFDNIRTNVGNSVFAMKLSPIRVAQLLWIIANKSSPRMRYIIGFDAHFYLLVKKLLPEKIWFYLLERAYRLRR